MSGTGDRVLPARRTRRNGPIKAVLFLAGIGLIAASVLGGAAPAFAHATLLFSTPAANSTVPVAPTELSLVFDETVTIDKTPITLAGPHGAVAVGAAVLGSGGTSVNVKVSSAAGRGIYTVHWQVTADDGDVIAGSYPFAVGPAAASSLSGTSAVDTRGAWETGVLRGLLFAALALSLGELWGPRLLRRIPNAPAPARSWMPWAPLLGGAASLGLALGLLGNGSVFAGIVDPTFGVLTSRPGIVAMIEIVGFFLAVIAVWIRHPAWAWLPLVAVVGGEVFRAHPGIANPLLGMPLTVLHLAGAALWVGTLVYVLRTVVAWRHQPGSARAAIAAYSRPAIWLFVIVVATGLASGLLLLPLNEVLTTDYGRVLLIKVFLVVVAAGFAWTARRRLHRKMVLVRLGRPARMEAISLAVVLALSAVLTVLPPPADPNAPLPFAPPASGPAVPVAALAGVVNINVQASAGQLVVQLNAPEISDQPGHPAPATSTLTGVLAGPTGKATALTFRSCGTGCFFTSVKWKNGASQLTFTPKVGSWASHKAAMTVQWPPRPAGDLLARAVAAMNAEPALTLYERVTGDSSRGPGPLQVFPMSGAEFIQHTLYASGKVPAIVRLPDVNGNRRLAISYPADNAVDELTIAPNGRILSETLTASDLISKTVVYHESGADG